jgi:hypothetical protein
MTSKVYLTKRRNGYYYIGFFEGSSRKWRTTKCTTKSNALQGVLHLPEQHVLPESVSLKHQARVRGKGRGRLLHLPVRGEVCDRVQEKVRHLTAVGSDSNRKLSPEIVDKAVDKLDAKGGRDEGRAW